jgi:hypothetical protein
MTTREILTQIADEVDAIQAPYYEPESVLRVAGRAYANRVHTTVESAVKAAWAIYRATAAQVAKRSEMSDEIQAGGKTVIEAKAERFIDFVEKGVTKSSAAKEVGITLEKLQQSGALGRAVRACLERARDQNLLGKETEETVARVRRLELMLQDKDPRVVASRVRSVADAGPQVAVQIDNNALLADPAVRESRKSLQIDVEAEKDA